MFVQWVDSFNFVCRPAATVMIIPCERGLLSCSSTRRSDSGAARGAKGLAFPDPRTSYQELRDKVNPARRSTHIYTHIHDTRRSF